jgi:murein DD-endopeptidase MepM/ murein hydrolase activator NlpD
VSALGKKSRGRKTGAFTIMIAATMALGLGGGGWFSMAQGQAPAPSTPQVPLIPQKVRPDVRNYTRIEIPQTAQAQESEPAETPPSLHVTGLLVPDKVKQGNVLKIYVSDPARLSPPDDSGILHLSAHFAGRKALFFKQKDGGALALMPVSVFQKPGKYPLSLEGVQNQNLKPLQISVTDAHFKTQNVNVSKSTEGLQPLPGELEAIQALKDRVSSTRYWDGDFVSPTPDCQNSPFGVLRMHNGAPTGDYHKGVDLRSPQGRPIRAINGGVVEIARMYRLHGGTVGVDHGQGISSIYIHMSKLNVIPGQHVNKGDVLGFVGSTGFATGPHLHWGMYVSGLPINPNQWVQVSSICY